MQPDETPPATEPSATEPPSGRSKRRRRPMRRRTKWILAVSVSLALVVGAVLGVSWQAGQSLLHPDRDRTDLTPSVLNLTWEWANLTTSDGVALAGWWIPADGAANGTVIFLHGYSDSKKQGLPIYPFLHNASMNVLAFDFRAHGESGGDYTTAGMLETAEVDAAIAWTTDKTGFGQDRIILFGWSMGAAAAINAAGNHPDLAGVIAESSFSRLRNIVDTSIGKFTGLPRWPFGPLAVMFASSDIGVDINDNAPIEAIAHYHGPLLLLQGLADTTVLPGQVDDLAAAAPQATVWRFPGAEHTECYKSDPVTYEQKVLDLLRTALPA